MREKALTKYKIGAVILLVVSVVFNILKKPVFNYLVLTGQEMQRPMQIFTFSFFLFAIEALLIATYMFFANNKVVSKFFAVALLVDIVSRIYSIISIIKLIVAYSNYNADIE